MRFEKTKGAHLIRLCFWHVVGKFFRKSWRSATRIGHPYAYVPHTSKACGPSTNTAASYVLSIYEHAHHARNKGYLQAQISWRSVVRSVAFLSLFPFRFQCFCMQQLNYSCNLLLAGAATPGGSLALAMTKTAWTTVIRHSRPLTLVALPRSPSLLARPTSVSSPKTSLSRCESCVVFVWRLKSAVWIVYFRGERDPRIKAFPTP